MLIKTLMCIFLFYSIQIFSSEYTIIKLKGQAWSQNQTQLKMGSIVKVPSLLTTGDMSYVSLEGSEGKIILGPNSKTYITKKDASSPTILQLLKGKLRGQIEGKENSSSKLYITTRSASLGVRGTDFLVVYNDKNHITSNLTIEGNVSFYKKKDEEILNSLKEEFDQQQINLDYDAQKQILQDELSDYKAININKGKFSGAYPTYDIALHPTMISPTQVAILSKDQTLGSTEGNKVALTNATQDNFTLTNKNLIPEPIDDVTPEKLSSDQKNSIIVSQVRQGGVLDTNTGIYIMPPTGAKYNEQTKTYELPYQYGGVDKNTGEYIPPADVKLDPLKGFVRNQNGKEVQVDSFSKSVSKLFDKYKNLTRVDLYADARYFYSLKTYESYYGEIRNISNAESMIFNFEGNIGRYLFNNQRYLHYIKAGLSMIYHNRQREPLIQRNDRIISHYGYEFHRKHNLFNRNASFIFDLDFETIYQDYQSKEQWDFYTESINSSVYERLKTSRAHQLEIGTTIGAYHGYIDQNHGNIYEGFVRNKFTPNMPWEFELDYSYKNRIIKQTADEFSISRIDIELTQLELLRKTNLTYQGSFFWSESEKKMDFDKSFTYIHKAELTRKKGEYLRLNCFYSYMRNKAKGVGSIRSFIGQTWGGGMTFIF